MERWSSYIFIKARIKVDFSFLEMTWNLRGICCVDGMYCYRAARWRIEIHCMIIYEQIWAYRVIYESSKYQIGRESKKQVKITAIKSSQEQGRLMLSPAPRGTFQRGLKGSQRDGRKRSDGRTAVQQWAPYAWEEFSLTFVCINGTASSGSTRRMARLGTNVLNNFKRYLGW